MIARVILLKSTFARRDIFDEKTLKQKIQEFTTVGAGRVDEGTCNDTYIVILDIIIYIYIICGMKAKYYYLLYPYVYSIAIAQYPIEKMCLLLPYCPFPNAFPRYVLVLYSRLLVVLSFFCRRLRGSLSLQVDLSLSL